MKYHYDQEELTIHFSSPGEAYGNRNYQDLISQEKKDTQFDFKVMTVLDLAKLRSICILTKKIVSMNL